jgi:ASC-1-like (ASCH) protein
MLDPSGDFWDYETLCLLQYAVVKENLKGEAFKFARTDKVASFASVSLADLAKAVTYHRQVRSDTKKYGSVRQLYDRPTDAASSLLNSTIAIQKNNPFGGENPMGGRLCGYADAFLLNSSSYWLTFNPKMLAMVVVFALALGPQVPPAKIREIMNTTFEKFHVLGTRPGAQAIFFQRFWAVTLKHVIGWSKEKGTAYRRGGLYGLPLNYNAAFECNGMQDLHVHLQLWLAHMGYMFERMSVAWKNDNKAREDMANDLKDAGDAAVEDILGKQQAVPPSSSFPESGNDEARQSFSDEDDWKAEFSPLLESSSDTQKKSSGEHSPVSTLECWDVSDGDTLECWNVSGSDMSTDPDHPEQEHDSNSVSVHDECSDSDDDSVLGDTPEQPGPYTYIPTFEEGPDSPCDAVLGGDQGPECASTPGLHPRSSVGPSDAAPPVGVPFEDTVIPTVHPRPNVGVSGTGPSVGASLEDVIDTDAMPPGWSRANWVDLQRQFTGHLEHSVMTELCLSQETQSGLMSCLDVSCQGTLTEPDAQVLESLRRKPKKNKPLSANPQVLTCSHCDRLCSHADIIGRALQTEKDRAGYSGEEPDLVVKLRAKWSGDHMLPGFHNPELANFLSAGFFSQGDSVSPDQDNRPEEGNPYGDTESRGEQYEHCVLQNEDNTHDPMHRTQCWKKGCCRYNCPHCAEKATGVVIKHGDGKLVAILVTYKRRPPFLYLSASTPMLTRLCAMNNFSKWVLDCRLSFYLTKYAYKPQDRDVDSLESMMKGLETYFKKITLSEADDPFGYQASRTAHSKGLGLLLSSVMGYSKSVQIPATMAGFYNVSGGRFEFAYEHPRWYVSRMVDFVTGNQVTAVLHYAGLFDTKIQDYYSRDPQHSSWSSFRFHQRYVRGSLAKLIQKKDNNYFCFQETHSLYSTCGYRPRDRTVVPLPVLDSSLPNLRDLEVETTSLSRDTMHQKRKVYALHALVMFRPHRTGEDLYNGLKEEFFPGVVGTVGWWWLFKEWKKVPDFTRDRYLKNIQAQHVRNFHDKRDNVFAQAGYDGDEPLDISEWGLESGRDVTVDTLENHTERTLHSLMEGDVKTQKDHLSRLTTGSNQVEFDLPDAKSIVYTVSNSNKQAYQNSIRVYQARCTLLGKQYLNFGTFTIDQDFLQLDVNVATCVRILKCVDVAVDDCVRVVPGPKRKVLPNTDKFPSIRSHLSHWNLNRIQWYGAGIMCLGILDTVQKHVLRQSEAYQGGGRQCILKRTSKTKIEVLIDELNLMAYTNRTDIPDAERSSYVRNYKNCSSFRLLLIGWAGAGKSHVVQCVIDFCKCWGVPEKFAVTATRGTAAANLRGTTIYSALGFGLDCSQSEINMNKADHRNMKKQWEQVGSVIVDEYGLYNGTKHLRTSKKIGKLKDQSDLPFGGMHTTFAADYMQPVDHQAMFKPAAVSFGELYNGMEDFRAFANCCLELQDQVRCDDPDWFEMTSRFAFNVQTPDDLKLINSQNALGVRQKLNSKSPLVHTVPHNGRIASRTNNDCAGGNIAILRKVAQNNPVDPLNPGSWRHRGPGLIFIMADLEFPEGLPNSQNNPLKHSQVHWESRIRCLPYTKTKRVTGSLGMCLGMLYRSTTNEGIKFGAVNGAVFIGTNLIFKPDDEDSCVRFHTSTRWGGGYHYVMASDVLALILKPENKDRQMDLFVDPSPSEMRSVDPSYDSVSGRGKQPLFLARGEIPVQVKTLPWTYQTHDRGKKTPVRITGFEIVSASVVTLESLQGLSLDYLMLLDMGNLLNNNQGYYYMAMTRVEKPHQLSQVFQLPSKEHYFQRRISVMVELQRLRQGICDRTYEWCHRLFDNPELDTHCHVSPVLLSSEDYTANQHTIHQHVPDHFPPPPNVPKSDSSHSYPLVRANLHYRYFVATDTGTKTGEIRMFKGQWKNVNAGCRVVYNCSKMSKEDRLPDGSLPDHPKNELLVFVTRRFEPDTLRNLLRAMGVSTCLPGCSTLDDAVDLYHKVYGSFPKTQKFVGFYVQKLDSVSQAPRSSCSASTASNTQIPDGPQVKDTIVKSPSKRVSPMTKVEQHHLTQPPRKKSSSRSGSSHDWESVSPLKRPVSPSSKTSPSKRTFVPPGPSKNIERKPPIVHGAGRVLFPGVVPTGPHDSQGPLVPLDVTGVCLLRDAMGLVVEGGFCFKWNSNLCHFDAVTFLLLGLCAEFPSLSDFLSGVDFRSSRVFLDGMVGLLVKAPPFWTFPAWTKHRTEVARRLYAITNHAQAFGKPNMDITEHIERLMREFRGSTVSTFLCVRKTEEFSCLPCERTRTKVVDLPYISLRLGRIDGVPVAVTMSIADGLRHVARPVVTGSCPGCKGAVSIYCAWVFPPVLFLVNDELRHCPWNWDTTLQFGSAKYTIFCVVYYNPTPPGHFVATVRYRGDWYYYDDNTNDGEVVRQHRAFQQDGFYPRMWVYTRSGCFASFVPVSPTLRIVRTAGDGDCCFHALFGTISDDSGKLQCAGDLATRMRSCFVSFLGFFDSIEDMHVNLKAQTVLLLQDFVARKRLWIQRYTERSSTINNIVGKVTDIVNKIDTRQSESVRVAADLNEQLLDAAVGQIEINDKVRFLVVEKLSNILYTYPPNCLFSTVASSFRETYSTATVDFMCSTPRGTSSLWGDISSLEVHAKDTTINVAHSILLGIHEELKAILLFCKALHTLDSSSAGALPEHSSSDSTKCQLITGCLGRALWFPNSSLPINSPYTVDSLDTQLDLDWTVVWNMLRDLDDTVLLGLVKKEMSFIHTCLDAPDSLAPVHQVDLGGLVSETETSLYSDPELWSVYVSYITEQRRNYYLVMEDLHLLAQLTQFPITAYEAGSDNVRRHCGVVPDRRGLLNVNTHAYFTFDVNLFPRPSPIRHDGGVHYERVVP